MPTLIIDADACPVTREALACARSARIPVLIAGNSTQNLARRIRRDDPRDAEHARGRDATGVRGHVYNKATIDMQLFIRHEEKKVRRAGGRTQGPAAFTDGDRERFQRNLTQLLREALDS